MNKLKVAIQSLREHLGADRRGLELLEQVTEIANSQRKRLAAVEEAAEASTANVSILRSTLDGVELEHAALNGTISRLSAKLAASEARERALVLKNQAPEDHDNGDQLEQDDELQALRRLIKDVWRRFKSVPLRRIHQKRTLIVEDFIKSYSHDEFAGLGMVMALGALMNLPFFIRSENAGHRRDAGFVATLGEKHMSRFVQWYKNAIRSDKFQDEVFEACGGTQAIRNQEGR